MNVIGLGNAGCSIADSFAQYPQYKIFKINVDIERRVAIIYLYLRQRKSMNLMIIPRLKHSLKGQKAIPFLSSADPGKFLVALLEFSKA